MSSTCSGFPRDLLSVEVAAEQVGAPSDLVDQVQVSGALSGARTGKGSQMANPHPTPKPENLRPPWPKGTSGNPAGSSRGRRISDAIERQIDEKALDREFGATESIGTTHVSRVREHGWPSPLRLTLELSEVSPSLRFRLVIGKGRSRKPEAQVLMLRCYGPGSSRGPVFLGETVTDDAF